ncbi:GNAT family N-acetyltransferase [candidate division KSB1 bacterium]
METGTLIQPLQYRREVVPADRETVRQIVASSGFFSSEEIEIAVELVDERLAKDDRSGYYFIFVENCGRPVGYSCYGPIGGTEASFNLYWIAVHDHFRGQGIGRELLRMTEEAIGLMGGKRIYLETSSREQYRSTKEFYLRRGYTEEAVLSQFYSDTDSKVIYIKVLERERGRVQNKRQSAEVGSK